MIPSDSPSSATLGQPALTASGLRKLYAGRVVVESVDLELQPGEVVGLLGPNGAGKTTTVGMLYGFTRADAGEVRIEGTPLTPQVAELKARLGIVAQENNLDPDFSVRDNLIHFAHHYRIIGQRAQVVAERLLERVELSSYANHRIDQLSGGLQRRLVLARALINDPRIIFLDEPTTGLDPDARQLFWKLILDLRSEGRSILLTTHYMAEAERVCDRLILLQSGKVIDSGSPKELIERIAGQEVIEVEGVEPKTLQALAEQFQSWMLNFSQGYLLGVPAAADQLWHEIQNLHPRGFRRRNSNLEDVFLLLTGARLE